ncbi:MAG: response regulator [Proteobacteria bacterium]|nr:response regulator [Pseudomonadota bacterium]MBU1711344.1 response regulator [Pseudomonadota bacterium]
MENFSGKVLVVDDNKLNRTLLSKSLNKAGYQVRTAADGRECLAMIEQQKPDIIISDYQMPHLDGMELCKIIKEDPKLKSIYFIMMTGSSDLEHKVRGLNIGADDYIDKSTSREELLARVNAGMRLKKMEFELKEAQRHLYHSEKLASLGQLAAGVAHEINNPIGFVMSNLGTLGKYFHKITEFLEAQSAIISDSPSAEEIKQLRKKLKLDFILKDIDDLVNESLEGTNRIKEIVQNLKNFSRVDEAETQKKDINECIENTLQVIWNELKYKTEVKKDFSELPQTICHPSQLNQVFMNILVNAAQAIEVKGEISIRTSHEDGWIKVVIADNGSGIPEEKLDRIFDPFFTTKKVGEGTGLGLSISHDIIQKHHGEISVTSNVGEGTAFTIKIPVVDEE